MPDDPYEDDGWFGREQFAEQTPVDEVPNRTHSQPANIVPEEPYVAPRDIDRAPSPPTRRLPPPTVNTWTVNGQLRPSNNTVLTFRAPPPPWYRTKQTRIALIAAASAAVAVPVVVLVWPSSPASSPGESTSVSPHASTSAQPAPSAQPTPINAPPPPPPSPPPPPPPPSEAPDSAPADSQPYWTRPAPPPTQKPDIGVTRTPVTRAPISVAPVPRHPSENNSSTPGDGRKRGCGGWC
jgi:hypothetical protein